MEAVPQTQQAAQTLLGTRSSDATHAMDDAQAQVAADKVIEESRKIVKDNLFRHDGSESKDKLDGARLAGRGGRPRRLQ